MTNLKIGDRVMLSANFLRSTGQYTGHAPFRRGVIEGLNDIGGHVLAIVKWDGVDKSILVNVYNLVREDKIAEDSVR